MHSDADLSVFFHTSFGFQRAYPGRSPDFTPRSMLLAIVTAFIQSWSLCTWPDLSVLFLPICSATSLQRFSILPSQTQPSAPFDLNLISWQIFPALRHAEGTLARVLLNSRRHPIDTDQARTRHGRTKADLAKAKAGGCNACTSGGAGGGGELCNCRTFTVSYMRAGDTSGFQQRCGGHCGVTRSGGGGGFCRRTNAGIDLVIAHGCAPLLYSI